MKLDHIRSNWIILDDIGIKWISQDPIGLKNYGLDKHDSLGKHDMVLTRCGRVMADNIAYAKFRKNLLI